MDTVVCNAGQAKRVVRQGVRYYVAPVSMIVPGVLPGSKGPLYYPQERVNRNPSEWDGVPITVGHPQKGGVHVSASDPGVEHIGSVRNSKGGSKLRAEAWIREDAVARHPEIHAALRDGTAMEVSTGLYTLTNAQDGSHAGRPYTHVVEDYSPDHLAVLPHTRGACSVADGCGLNVNEWSDAAREAAAAARKLASAGAAVKSGEGNARARMFAEQATRSAKAGDSEQARYEHSRAAHWHRQAGEEDAARAHDEAAKAHGGGNALERARAEVARRKAAGVYNTGWTDEAREASIAARQASAAAREASSGHAKDSGFVNAGQHIGHGARFTAADHEAHARAHEEVAKVFRADVKAMGGHGPTEAVAKAHEEAAYIHKDAAGIMRDSGDTSDTKKALAEHAQMASSAAAEATAATGMRSARGGAQLAEQHADSAAKGGKDSEYSHARASSMHEKVAGLHQWAPAGKKEGAHAEAAARHMAARIYHNEARSVTTNKAWTQEQRDEAPAKDFAGPHESFPVESQKDVEDAARLVGHADDPAAVRQRIAAIARRKGLELPASWKEDTVTDNAVQMLAGLDYLCVNDFASEDQQKAFFGLLKEHHLGQAAKSEGHARAAEASAKAVRTDELTKKSNMERRAGMHTRAVSEHMEAAAAHRAVGNHDIAAAHDRSAGEHISKLNSLRGGDAKGAASRAADAASKAAGEHETLGGSADRHELSATMHRQLAGVSSSAAEASAHHNAAEHHERAAEHYRGTRNQLNEELMGTRNEWSDAAREAAALARQASAKAHAETHETDTKKAVYSSGKAKAAADTASNGPSIKAHMQAQAEHENAANIHDKGGNRGDKEAAAMHREAAKAHVTAAEKIRYTSNQLNEGVTVGTVDWLIANCACWDERDRATLNAFPKEKLERLKQGTLAANAGFPPKKPGNAAEDAQDGGADDAQETAPAAAPKQQPCMNEWMKSAPAEVQRVVQHANRITAKEKRGLVDKLVANSANQELARKYYDGKTLEELQTVNELHGTPHGEEADFFGSAGGPTHNSAFDDTDVLPLPTMDYSQK